MIDSSLFDKFFQSDLNKVIKQFLSSLPTKTDTFFADSFHQYLNQYTVEFANGEIITDSMVTLSGAAQRIIEGKLIQHIAKPLIPKKPGLIALSSNILNNQKRISFIKKAERIIINKHATLEGLAIKWTSYDKYIYIVNSNSFAGSKIETFASISVNSKIKRDGELFDGRAVLSVNNERENINPQKIAELIENAIEDAENSVNAKEIKSGTYDVVFSNNASGVLFHEVIGHLVEADYVYNKQSILESGLNTIIASPELTLVDGPVINGPVGYRFDDEGTKAKPTKIIENGVLKSFLADQYHSLNMHIDATGNGRRTLYSSQPQPRMSNTIIKPGLYPADEILASTKKGIFVTDAGNGYVNTASGNFQFDNCAGFYIEKGSIIFPLNNFRITGNAIEALKSIKMIGNDFNVSSFHADCEKENQIVPVGFAQPTVKILDLNIS